MTIMNLGNLQFLLFGSSYRTSWECWCLLPHQVLLPVLGPGGKG